MTTNTKTCKGWLQQKEIIKLGPIISYVKYRSTVSTLHFTVDIALNSVNWYCTDGPKESV